MISEWTQAITKRQKLFLDFIGASSLDSRITFTGPASASYFNSSGVLSYSSTNTPRFDYDPVTLAPLGLLIEGTRTNLNKQSSNPADASWSVSNAAKTSTTALAPDGTSTAMVVTADGTSSFHRTTSAADLSISYTSGTTYTMSCFVKAGTTNLVQMSGPTSAFGASAYANYQLTGAGSVTASTGGTATISQISGGYYRITFACPCTLTTTSSGPSLYFITSATDPTNPTNTSTDSFTAWGMQVEAATFASSYIITGASSATRTGDVVVLPTTGWYNTSEGTFFVAFDCYSAAAEVNALQNIFVVDDGTNANRIIVRRKQTTGDLESTVVYSSVFQTTPGSAGALVKNTIYKIAFSVKAASSLIFAQNGSSPTDGSTTGLNPMTRMNIGNASGGQLFGHFRAIKYYSKAFSKAKATALTQ